MAKQALHLSSHSFSDVGGFVYKWDIIYVVSTFNLVSWAMWEMDMDLAQDLPFDL